MTLLGVRTPTTRHETREWPEGVECFDAVHEVNEQWEQFQRESERITAAQEGGDGPGDQAVERRGPAVAAGLVRNGWLIPVRTGNAQCLSHPLE